MTSRTHDLIVSANPDSENCLADAAAEYIAQHRGLRGYDLSPRWTDDSRESVTLSVPAWHYEAISDTSGT